MVHIQCTGKKPLEQFMLTTKTIGYHSSFLKPNTSLPLHIHKLLVDVDIRSKINNEIHEVITYRSIRLT